MTETDDAEAITSLQMEVTGVSDNLHCRRADAGGCEGRPQCGTATQRPRPIRRCRTPSRPRTDHCHLPSQRKPLDAAPARRPTARETAASTACRHRLLTTATREGRRGTGRSLPRIVEVRTSVESERRRYVRRRRGPSALRADRKQLRLRRSVRYANQTINDETVAWCHEVVESRAKCLAPSRSSPISCRYPSDARCRRIMVFRGFYGQSNWPVFTEASLPLV